MIKVILGLQSPRELGVCLRGIHEALNWCPALNKIKLYMNTYKQCVSIINTTNLVPKNVTKGDSELHEISIF